MTRVGHIAQSNEASGLAKSSTVYFSRGREGPGPQRSRAYGGSKSVAKCCRRVRGWGIGKC
jgi:hypothetical protein